MKTKNSISLFTFLDMIGCDLELTRFANQDDRWTVRIKYCEIKEGVILVGAYGNGNTPLSAMLDYIDKIKGKRIVINATSSKSRMEYNVPDSICYEE